jgi:hypothetical protein
VGDWKPSKKYPGQDRWLEDMQRVRDMVNQPCGPKTMFDGKPVGFDRKMVVELLRRREASTEADSLRSRSYDGGGGGGSSDFTQTEAASLAGLPGDEGKPNENDPDDWRLHVQPDPIGKLVEECLAELDILSQHSRRFMVKLSVILNAGAAVKERRNEVPVCKVCDKPIDEPGAVHHRGRYCGKCNKAWERTGRPHGIEEDRWAEERRAEFEREHKLFNQLQPESGYRVDELDGLVAAGVLPPALSKSA